MSCSSCLLSKQKTGVEKAKEFIAPKYGLFIKRMALAEFLGFDFMAIGRF